MKRKRNSLESSFMAMASSSSIKTRSNTITMLSEGIYLPDECWESVLKFLIDYDTDDNHRRYFHLKSLSLVSKQLLSVTNRLRSSLTIYYPTCQLFSNLFRRFSNIVSLNLSSYYGDLNDVLIQISHFPLNISSLNLSNQLKIPAKGLRAFSQNIASLTSLICSNIATLYDTDLLLIADRFPFLQELDLSNPTQFKFDRKYVSISAQVFSLALSEIRKVNLSHDNIFFHSLVFYLFKNCKFLKEIIMIDYCKIIKMASVVRKRPTLRSLSNSNFNNTPHFGHFASYFIASLVCLKSLTSLDLFAWKISDELLTSIAREGLPLTKLFLRNCVGYSYNGIFCLLSKCQGMQYLDLQKADFLNDQHVTELSLLLGNLVSINLSKCSMLTESTLFSLISNCPSLIEIKMEWTSIGKESVEKNSSSLMDCRVNYRLKSLYLGHCLELRDETIIMLSSIFPSLQLLDLTSCEFISDEGIDQILKRFCNIRHLSLANCSRVKLLVGMNFEVPKLEVLNLSLTRVDDETLYAISKGCRGLLQLYLENCDCITKKGVKHVVENCTQLREINLRDCHKVPANVSSILFSSLSLRKIVAPPRFHFSERKMKLFSRHGCLISYQSSNS
ncbi:F-box/LRR-repeat protein 14-like [Vicia villosa]|uniref:F-box/LRR-repeat protein 14-like n=1 Tax=Vicia villosa TaxID=3911 RepID=UPI00273ACB67|nr:F-box/LRR-repeat protein 14-like [Vicia villosa]